MSTKITISSLVKAYPAIGRAGITKAVDGVKLTIEPGELFFLLGPSGCGKTTLLRMIAGFIEPTEGTIKFDENDVTRTPPNKRNTGMVFQSYALWPHMTVAQNVAFGLNVRKVAPQERDRRVVEALAQVQMEAYADRKPTQLSGGQQQRVALARALVVRPGVLLLDEPLSNLDAKLRLELRSQIRAICKESGLTTIYVTHDQKEALSMADRIAIMQAGQVCQIGTPTELYRKPDSQFVAAFLGEADILPATCQEKTEANIVLETAVGMMIASKASERVEVKPDSPMAVCVRPESWKLAEDETTENRLVGTVENVIYLGELTQLLIGLKSSQTNGTLDRSHLAKNRQILVSLLNRPPETLPGVGQSISVRVDPADVIVLPVDGASTR